MKSRLTSVRPAVIFIVFIALIVTTTSVTYAGSYKSNGISSDGETMMAYDESSVIKVRRDVIRYSARQVNLVDSEEEKHVQFRDSYVEVDCNNYTQKFLRGKVILFNGETHTINFKKGKNSLRFTSDELGGAAALRVCESVGF